MGRPPAGGQPLHGRDQDEEDREEAEEDVEGDGVHQDRHFAREEETDGPAEAGEEAGTASAPAPTAGHGLPSVSRALPELSHRGGAGF